MDSSIQQVSKPTTRGPLKRGLRSYLCCAHRSYAPQTRTIASTASTSGLMAVKKSRYCMAASSYPMDVDRQSPPALRH